VHLVLSPDQDFFHVTTARFIAERCSPAVVRAFAVATSERERTWWRQGADLGWTAPLGTEALGGGSVSGDGLIDLTLIADAFGANAAPGPLVPVNVVIDSLVRGGDPDQLERWAAPLVSGEQTAAWCFSGCDVTRPTVAARAVRGGYALSGSVRPVGAANDAAFLLVPVMTDAGVAQFVVPAGVPGVTIERLECIDLTQRFGAVNFDEVVVDDRALVGALGDVAPVERALQVALVLQIAEMVGALGRLFDMTLEYMFDRYSFGRPLASYQALKHRFADMASWLEACRSTADAAATAVQAETADGALLVSVAKAYVADRGPELAHECVQFHGGIGVTTEHDLHLYLRRVVQSSMVFGGVRDHRQRVARMIEERYL
jgi:alkylation response protein AidB-like acyl-CoA dehydrogenase